MKHYTFAKITVRPYPNVCDVANKWIFTPDIVAVLNVSQKRREAVVEAILQKGIEYYHLPLDEEVDDIGWSNILEAVAVLRRYEQSDGRVLVHCDGGAHRSRLVVEAFHFAKCGYHLSDPYKGYENHLIYDSLEGHLPPLSDVEETLLRLYSL